MSKFTQAYNKLKRELILENQNIENQNDIIMQGWFSQMLKGVKNKLTFGKYSQVIVRLINQFCEKYKFTPATVNGETIVGVYAKFEKGFIISFKIDYDDIEGRESDGNNLSTQILWTVYQNDGIKKISSLTDLSQTITPKNSPDDLAKFINQHLLKLNVKLTTNLTKSPSKIRQFMKKVKDSDFVQNVALSQKHDKDESSAHNLGKSLGEWISRRLPNGEKEYIRKNPDGTVQHRREHISIYN